MKVTGSNITITDSVVNKMQILPLGNAKQDGTPTPDNPIDVKVVTGDNQVVVQNRNLVDWGTQSFTTYKDYTGLDIKAGTYTFSAKVTSSDTSYNISRVYFYGDNYSTIVNLNRDIRSNATVTLAQNINRIVLYSSIDFTSSSGKTATYENIQLEKGSTATSYVAHQEQSYTLHLGSLELCKIGDYQDVITGTKDNWKVEKKTTKFTIDNNTTMTDADANGKRRIRISVTNILRPSSNGAVGQILCSHYLKKSSNQTYLQNQGISIDATGDYIYIYDSRYNTSDTMETLKTWLIENNVTIIFVNATPTEETITDTTLINELNGLQELLSYDGTTNITITSDSNNAQMSVEVTYTSESDMNEKLAEIFNSIKSKLYHIIRAL